MSAQTPRLVDTDGRDIVVRIEPVTVDYSQAAPPLSVPMLAAVRSLADGLPALRAGIQQAASVQRGLEVVFSGSTMRGIADGSLRLVEAAGGSLGVARDARTGHIVEHARVVAPRVAAGAGAIPVAAMALPMVVATAAAYGQQLELERALASIQTVIERLEERLDDADIGTCEAAERFLLLLAEARSDGGPTGYLVAELAAHRTAVEALYSSRRQWVTRFKDDLERQQIAREKAGTSAQPWVDVVIDQVKQGRLEKDVTLFVRSLLTRTKLAVVTAAVIAEEGRGVAAAHLLRRIEEELRREFYDLHRRLRPLADHQPELTGIQRLPGMGGDIRRAHQLLQTLVSHLDRDVLPVIPDPSRPQHVPIVLNADTVAELSTYME